MNQELTNNPFNPLTKIHFSIPSAQTVRLTAYTVDGRRVATLELFPDLKVRAVRDGDGRELPWIRSTWSLHVVLPRPMNLGERLTLEVDYDGVILDRWEKGILLLRDTVFWHPHTGDVDRALYDVTIRWPTGLRRRLPSRGR